MALKRISGRGFVKYIEEKEATPPPSPKKPKPEKAPKKSKPKEASLVSEVKVEEDRQPTGETQEEDEGGG